MSEEHKSFWGKLAVLTAFLSALVGLGTLVKQCSEDNYTPSETYAPTAPTTPVYPSPQGAGFCCDMWGNRRCMLISTIPVGSQCFCPGQGYGVACP